MLATQTITLKALTQTAQFVSQLFASQPGVPKEFSGSLVLSSGLPIAVVGLRFRGENFSTVPATSLTGPVAVPVINMGPAGGAGAVILPQFVAGVGWAAEPAIANTGTVPLVVRVDLFKQDGTPLVVTLNGTTSSSISGITIPPGGVVVLSPPPNTNNGNDDDGF